VAGVDAPDPGRVEVQRVFRASRERVFDAWTRPALIKQWNARPGVTVPLVEVDLRVGGPYRLHLRGPDGTVHRVVGVYQVVDPPTRLVYTWRTEGESERSESIVTVEFKDCPSGTHLTLRHEQLHAPASTRRHQAGWEACLVQLEETLTRSRDDRSNASTRD
jgi:uncharacterized protein YndB with AHSA1/START domain